MRIRFLSAPIMHALNLHRPFLHIGSMPSQMCTSFQQSEDNDKNRGAAQNKPRVLPQSAPHGVRDNELDKGKTTWTLRYRFQSSFLNAIENLKMRKTEWITHSRCQSPRKTALPTAQWDTFPQGLISPKSTTT